jgi:hypothetical protein
MTTPKRRAAALFQEMREAVTRARHLVHVGEDVKARDVGLILIWLDSRMIEINVLREKLKTEKAKARDAGWREGYEIGFEEAEK